VKKKRISNRRHRCST